MLGRAATWAGLPLPWVEAKLEVVVTIFLLFFLFSFPCIAVHHQVIQAIWGKILL